MATARKKTRAPLAPTASYFAQNANEKGLPFVSSGCCLLDCALGGGWVLGRVVNIVGDKSTGKTLQAIETGVNFAHAYPSGVIRYAEAEAAFDDAYAQALGWPSDRVTRPVDGELTTVEDLFADIESTIDQLAGNPCLYIIDSLDALSTKAELERKPGENTYGTEKAKVMSEGFRKLVQRIERSRMLLLVISQVRDNIGAMFGESKTRSGGKALDFYASQIVWLADLGKVKRTVSGIERVVGLNVKAQIKKNKVGLAWRTIQYPIVFGYGIDDIWAGLAWLLDVCGKEGHPLLDELRISKTGLTAYCQKMREQGLDTQRVLRKQVNEAVVERWAEIETMFLPKASKYG